MERAARSKQDERKKSFKKGLDASESRRRREEQHTNIRKNKREELALKRRNIHLDESAPQSAEDTFLMSGEADCELSSFIQLVRSNDPTQILHGTRSIRKILSRESQPPIDAVLESGIVPRFVELLGVAHNQIQFEAAWALTNIASGTSEHTKAVISAGAVPAFVAMSQNADSEENREQATWALGNIAGDSCQCRDYVLSCNALRPLLHNLQTSHNPSFLSNGTWALSNLVRGKPAPDFNLIRGCLPVLYRLLNVENDDVLGDACWALSYLTDGEDYKIQAVIEEGLLPRLVRLLSHSNLAVVTPALRTVGNIVTGNQSQTQAALDLGALPAVLKIMTSTTNRNIIKECVWTISNVTAGTQPQIGEVMKSGFLPHLLELFQEGEFEIRKEAAWSVTNAISGGSNEQIVELMHAGFLKPLTDLLTSHDSKVIMICMEAIQKILKVGETLASAKTNDVNPYALALEQNGGLDALEDLQNHSLKRVHDLATSLLDDYFDGEDENIFEPTNQAAAAPTTGPTTFTFGATPQQFNMSGAFVF